MGEKEPGTHQAEHAEDKTSARTPLWSRIVIGSAAALAVLLVGATIGMFLTQTMRDEPAPEPGAGSVEVGFAQDMSVHHLQAVTMANLAREKSSDPQIKQIAFDISTSQLEQVGRMKGWLMLWDQPQQTIGEYMTWMSGPSGHDHGAMGAATESEDAPPMPGMATNEELARLRSLSSAELDVYFLQLMLRHHQGGTDMARYAQQHSPLPAVDALTTSMLRSQGAEMDLMTKLLAERDAQPLPFP